MKHSLLLTFDYEVFLGGISGSVSRCLLSPTEAVRRIMDNVGCKGLFFVDSLYLKRLADEPSALCRHDARLIHQQLEGLVKDGHEVAIHIHPHWLDAHYSEPNNNWDGSDRRRFALSCFEEELLDQVVHESIVALEPYMDMQQELKFRAGGFYAQPFEHILPVFRKYNVLKDFSVMRDFVSTGFENRYSFNYSSPPESFIYRFASDPLKAEHGDFTEVSVNSFPLSGIIRLRNSLYYRRKKNNPEYIRMGDGRGSGNVITHRDGSGFMSKLISHQNFCIELMNPVIADGYLQYLKQEGFVHFVSHPKLFTPGGLEAFAQFLPKALQAQAETNIESILKSHLEHQ